MSPISTWIQHCPQSRIRINSVPSVDLDFVTQHSQVCSIANHHSQECSINCHPSQSRMFHCPMATDIDIRHCPCCRYRCCIRTCVKELGSYGDGVVVVGSGYGEAVRSPIIERDRWLQPTTATLRHLQPMGGTCVIVNTYFSIQDR